MVIVKEIVEQFMKPVEGEIPSPMLHPLLVEFYESIIETPSELQRVKMALINLLAFLSTSGGRTNANCSIVNNFVLIDDHWERNWNELPEKYTDVIELMADALHDTISDPDIPINFGCTPEHKLEQAKQLP